MPTVSSSVERKHSFTDKNKIYNPHSSQVVLSNANLTDNLIGSIVQVDPAMAVHFDITAKEGQAYDV